jgi:hypothetical protein
MFSYSFTSDAIYVYFVAAVLVAVVTALQFRFRFLQLRLLSSHAAAPHTRLAVAALAILGPFPQSVRRDARGAGAAIVTMLLINAWP